MKLISNAIIAASALRKVIYWKIFNGEKKDSKSFSLGTVRTLKGKTNPAVWDDIENWLRESKIIEKATWEENEFDVEIITDSEIQSFNFNQPEKSLSFQVNDENKFDLIYFDAFGYRAQAEMWDVGIIQQMYDALKEGGVLVSYAARGQFKRDLKDVGFKIEALPGPPGKREMTRATKGSNQ